MNCRYTDEELKADVETTIGIRAKESKRFSFAVFGTFASAHSVQIFITT